MDKDNKINQLLPGWRQRIGDRTIPSFPPYNSTSGVDQNSGAMSLAESRYLQSQMLQLSGMNDHFNRMGQVQHKNNISLSSLSSFHNPIIDSDGRINRNQNILPVQDQQLYFRQEHQRLKDRLRQEIFEKKQSADNLYSSQQLFQDNEERGTLMMSNLLQARKADEFRRNIDKQIREETNRVDAYVQKNQRGDNLRRLHQDLYGKDSTDRACSNLPITQSEKSAYVVACAPPEDASRRMDTQLLQNTSNDEGSVIADETNGIYSNIHPSSIRKYSVSNEDHAIAINQSKVIEPSKSKVGASPDVVDLTDDADIDMEDTALVSHVLIQQLSSPVITAPSSAIDHPPIVHILSDDDDDDVEEEKQLPLSLLLQAIDQESVDTLLKSSNKAVMSVDSDEITPTNHTSLDDRQILSGSFSKFLPAAVVASMKRNKELFKIECSKDINDMVPKLPSEPLLDKKVLVDGHAKDKMQLPVIDADSSLSLTVTEPTYIRIKPSISLSAQDPSTTFPETWWPKSVGVRNENIPKKVRHHSKQSVVVPSFSGSVQTHEPLMNEVEPGVLEKLPYCKLYDKRLSNGSEPSNHMYCVQVTTMFCMSPILCCSECYTWRHAECGGHHTRINSSSLNPIGQYKNFKPICDRCYTEKPLLQHYPDTKKRIQKQRIDHLRREQMTSAVMNVAASSSLSVSDAQPPFHNRNVSIRYEKALKKWNNMVDVIGTVSSKSKTMVDMKEKEYDRLLKFFEDAEEATDRHNMVLFLERDTSRKVPIGFEDIRKTNIFDPLDNTEIPFIESSSPRHIKKKRKEPSLDIDQEFATIDEAIQGGPLTEETFIFDEKGVSESSDITSDGKENAALHTGRIVRQGLKVSSTGQENGKQDDDSIPLVTQPSGDKCIRSCCSANRRFDSLFCSDGCGVASMESDLLRSLFSHASFRNRKRNK